MFSSKESFGSASTVFTEAITSTLVQQLNWTVICTDSANTVLKTYGDVSGYFRHDSLNRNLVELLPPTLAIALNIVKAECIKTNKTVSKKGVNVELAGSMRNVQLLVTPFTVQEEPGLLFIVMLKTDSQFHIDYDELSVNSDDAHHSEHLLNLEQEFNGFKELVTTGEQLKHFLDSMQSFNKELFEANKSLQTVNAELQSLNEELYLTLNKKNSKLNQANADLENFIYTASHDLLSPLDNIEGSISVINLINVTNPELKKFLDILSFSVKKFRSLIVDITAISTLDGEYDQRESVDLNELIDDIGWSLSSTIKSNNVVITRGLEIDRIIFQRNNLRSILYNLVSNSVKFKRDENPLIHIQTQQLDGNFILSVHDNGIGIPLESQEKIFDMRNRLDNNVDGSGIGLFLVKKLVDAVNGTIKVKSVVNQGSEFIISFKV